MENPSTMPVTEWGSPDRSQPCAKGTAYRPDGDSTSCSMPHSTF